MNTSLMLGIGQGLADIFEGFVGAFFYEIFNIIFWILDILQGLFRSLVGLKMSTASEAEYDLVFKLIQTDTAVDMFLSMVIAGVVLLLVFTVLAIIRNLYQEKQKPVLEFVKLGFKGLSGFLLVPITVVLGLAFSNVLIILVDNVTAQGTTHKVSATLFVSGAYQANELRNDTASRAGALENILAFSNFGNHPGVKAIIGDANTKSELNGLALEDRQWDTLATLLDECVTHNCHGIDYYNSISIAKAYNLFEINYLILAIGGFSLIGILFKIAWGLAGRVINCLIGFITIPIVLSIYPLDEGSAYGSWKGFFIKNLTMGYSTIGILNIYYSIIPILNDFELGYTGFAGGIIKLIISVAALGGTSAFISTFNGWLGKLGLGDVVAEGDKVKKNATDAWKSVSDRAGKVATNALVGFGAYKASQKIADEQGLKGFKRFGTIAGSMADATGLTKGMDKFNIAKMRADGEKSAKENAKKWATGTRFIGNEGSDKAKKEKERYEINEKIAKAKKAISKIDEKDPQRENKIKRINDNLAKELTEGNYDFVDEIVGVSLSKVIKEYKEDLDRAKEDLSTKTEHSRSILNAVKSEKQLQGLSARMVKLLEGAGMGSDEIKSWQTSNGTFGDEFYDYIQSVDPNSELGKRRDAISRIYEQAAPLRDVVTENIREIANDLAYYKALGDISVADLSLMSDADIQKLLLEKGFIDKNNRIEQYRQISVKIQNEKGEETDYVANLGDAINKQLSTVQGTIDRIGKNLKEANQDYANTAITKK